jgi:curli biogenesis system outer membrane secretion channel CsgG
MKAHRMSALITALLVVAGLIYPVGSQAATKRRIAIMPFDYGAVTSHVGSHDVGNGIVSLLITKLVNDGTYSVVDRQQLDAILKEQNLSVSDRADPATACKIGKILSVDAIIVGTVTEFGFESHHTDVGGAASAAGSYIPYVGGFGFGHVGHSTGKCKVSVDARMVDINTSEILAAVHGSGESKRSGTSLWGGGGGGWSGGGGGFDSGSSEFASSIAGEATLQAVDEIGTQLIASASKIPDNQSIAAANVQGKVADVTGTQVVVNVGKVNGIAVGDNLQVERVVKQIKDPDSGKVLKSVSNTIAIVSVSEADANSATGNIIKGAGVRVGDDVRKVTTDVTAVIIQATPDSGSHPASTGATPARKPAAAHK